MIAKRLGRTSLSVSQLGFGCGSMGGLLVRGDYPTMREVVARALELGINYFDTAPMYGAGQSEVNLGAVLRELRADVLIGTKVLVSSEDTDRIQAAMTHSVDASLRRLGLERIDLIQLHNRFDPDPPPGHSPVRVADLELVARAFETLHQQGKVRYWGFTGIGETDALHSAVGTGLFQTIQLPYNLLNPSAALAVPPRFPFQDYKRIMDGAVQQGLGVIVIRMLAGGAIAGTAERHPVASPTVDPIASAPSYQADVARVQRFSFLVEEGVVDSLTEAAIRFVISNPNISTALLGISSREQLEQAVRYVERGPLPTELMERIVEEAIGLSLA